MLSASLSAGLLILRIAVGLTIAAHGSQKTFGWFGGAGLAKTVSGFQRQGLRPGWLWAALMTLGEVGGGLSLALGFLTPLGAAGVVGAMVMAIFMVHWRNGFWNAKRGFEYPLQLFAAALALGLTGPGVYSLDTLERIHPPAALFPVLAAAAILTVALGLRISARSTPATQPA